jgi:epoxyqueuosine reductase
VALGNNAGPEAVPALTNALNDDEPLVRGHVAWALGRIGSADALAALRQRLLSEENPDVRKEIEEALCECNEAMPDG